MRTHSGQPVLEDARERALAGAQAPSGEDAYRVAFDEYRVKLYKVACRAARDEREKLRLQWEQRDRERD